MLDKLMAAVDSPATARVGSLSAAKSRRSHHRAGTRSTDAVVELSVSPPAETARQSASLPPLSTRLHAAVSQGLVDAAADLLDSGVICGPDKVLSSSLLLLEYLFDIDVWELITRPDLFLVC